MPKIAVITDSDCSLSAEIKTKYQIRTVPISINFGTESYLDGIQINDKELFERIDREKKLPTTSAPSTGQFSRAFQTAFDDGYESIICLCVSSEVSATYSAALGAKEMVGGDISVIDTRSLSMGEGFMVLAAAESVQKGESKEAAMAAAMDIGNRVKYYGALSTLKYLAMSGRVGHLAAGMAGLLNIQPILTIRNGKLEMLEKVRTRKKALARLIELAQEAVLTNEPGKYKSIARMALVHVNALDELKEFEGQLRSAISCPEEIMICELGPGLSVHSGSGLIAVAIVTEK